MFAAVSPPVRLSRHHLNHGNHQQIHGPPPSPVAYNVLPGWITRKRAILSRRWSVLVGPGQRRRLRRPPLPRARQDLSHQPDQRGRWARSVVATDRRSSTSGRARSASTSSSTGTVATQHSGAYLTDFDHGRLDSTCCRSSASDCGDLDSSRLVRAHPAQERPVDRSSGSTSHTQRGCSARARSHASAVDAGAAVADPLMEHLLGIGINYFVGVDFNAFEQAVNAVGGININVPAGFTDYQYPAGECDLGNCGYETVHFNAGMQHMNGATSADLLPVPARQQRTGIGLRTQPPPAADHRRAQSTDREHRWHRQAAGCHQCARKQRAHQPDDQRRRGPLRTREWCQPRQRSSTSASTTPTSSTTATIRTSAVRTTCTRLTRASSPSPISSRMCFRLQAALGEAAHVTFVDASGGGNNALEAGGPR